VHLFLLLYELLINAMTLVTLLPKRQTIHTIIKTLRKSHIEQTPAIGLTNCAEHTTNLCFTYALLIFSNSLRMLKIDRNMGVMTNRV
jgi:hypothetical protein